MPPIPENLLESELFGHEKGAFTDAKAHKRGTFELADGGTVVLDEIGELRLDLQAKLLHFLEERRFRRVGGTREIAVDVRVIALTNRDLQGDGRATSTFRNDLFYRLNVFPITVPPLRERTEDILPLARHFLATLGRKFGRRFDGIDREAENRLLAYSWPGNVRELRNVIERAMVLERGRTISAARPDARLGERRRRRSASAPARPRRRRGDAGGHRAARRDGARDGAPRPARRRRQPDPRRRAARGHPRPAALPPEEVRRAGRRVASRPSGHGRPAIAASSRGSCGTALAQHLSPRGEPVRLLVLDQSLILQWLVRHEFPDGLEILSAQDLHEAEQILAREPPVPSTPPSSVSRRRSCPGASFQHRCATHAPPIPVLYETCLDVDAAPSGSTPPMATRPS